MFNLAYKISCTVIYVCFEDLIIRRLLFVHIEMEQSAGTIWNDRGKYKLSNEICSFSQNLNEIVTRCGLRLSYVSLLQLMDRILPVEINCSLLIPFPSHHDTVVCPQDSLNAFFLHSMLQNWIDLRPADQRPHQEASSPYIHSGN